MRQARTLVAARALAALAALAALVALATLATLAACGGGGGAGGDDDEGIDHDPPCVGSDAGPGADAGPAPTIVGEIAILEVRDGFDDGTGSGVVPRRSGHINGRLFDGPEPIWHDEVMNDGTCRLLEYTPASCDEYCEGVCVATNDCRPYPVPLSAGALTVAGLLRGPLLLPYREAIGYYPQDIQPENLFDRGNVVTASVPGTPAMPAFETATAAVARLVAAISNYQITLANGADHVVSWTPSCTPGARVRLTLNSNNLGHGAPFVGIIECDVADEAGQIRVPAAMVDAFPATENWQACAGNDCPRSSLRRYTHSFANVPGGAVRLVVGSEIDFGVVHRP